MHRWALLTILAAALCVAQPGQSSPQRGGQTTAVRGSVMNGTRGPMETVVVTLEGNNFEVLDMVFTDGRGAFAFRNVPANNNTYLYIAVNVAGFMPVRMRLEGPDLRGGLVNINLEPTNPPRAGEGREGTADNPFVVDLRQLEAVIPPEATAEFDLAVEALGEGRREDAIERLERVVRLAPDYYAAWLQLGTEFFAIERYDEAESAYLSAREVNPSGVLAAMNLGVLAHRRGELSTDQGRPADSEFREARRFLEDALNLDPRSGPARFYLGATLYRLDMYPEAEDALIAALETGESPGDARLVLINIYLRQSRAFDALEQVGRFLEENPDAPQRLALEDLRLQLETAVAR